MVEPTRGTEEAFRLGVFPQKVLWDSLNPCMVIRGWRWADLLKTCSNSKGILCRGYIAHGTGEDIISASA